MSRLSLLDLCDNAQLNSENIAALFYVYIVNQLNVCYAALKCYAVLGDKQKETLRSRLWKWVYERFGVYIEDFRFQPEENTVETEEPLSAKR